MKVLLIHPPIEHMALSFRGWSLGGDSIGLYPPIGLMYLAAYMRKSTGYEVRILDAVAERLGPDGIGQYSREFSPDLVGLTATTPTFYDVMESAKAVRQACPKAHICIGGPHTTFWWGETVRKPEVDSVVLGEGERTFTELALSLDKRTPLTRVRGLVFKEGGRVIKNGGADVIEDLDSIPPPAVDLVPFKRYCSFNAAEKSVAMIFGSRGCPFQCTYCYKGAPTFRVRSVESVLDEMQMYYDLGIREFLFFDDVFNVPPKRAIEVSEGILGRGLKVRWTFRGRADHITEELVIKAKKAGCALISLGIEDCTDEGLRMIKKGISIAQVMEAVRIIKRHGIETSTNWIIGLPRHRSDKDIAELLRFAKKVDSTYAQFMVLVPYVGTEIYADGVAKGVLKPEEWADLVKEPSPDALLPVWDEHLSREQLGKLYHRCYREYYFRPSYVLRSILSTRSLRGLAKKMSAAVKLI
jgi:anaerobic magnesium-protoporphyrin IX monomethyl ester cyclase